MMRQQNEQTYKKPSGICGFTGRNKISKEECPYKVGDMVRLHGYVDAEIIALLNNSSGKPYLVVGKMKSFYNEEVLVTWYTNGKCTDIKTPGLDIYYKKE